MSKEDDLKRIDEIKTQIDTLTREAMKIADRHQVIIHFDLELTRARGAGGMSYHPVGHASRYNDDYSYYTPDSYGGWRSSATDHC